MDLVGTELAVDNEFIHRGHLSAGEWNFTYDEQVVSLKGGGYCGWVSPVDAKSEDDAWGGGWFVQLKLRPIYDEYFLDFD
jgi:hypothetical protein